MVLAVVSAADAVAGGGMMFEVVRGGSKGGRCQRGGV